ncbi:MAG: deoxyribose-phosphate aldolase [Bacteroidales bacterium]|jgi:deoxyribose-phosphate aldolase|nr:deoxyribose-phosphate aldolase [Bacteroidales bacterium]
MENLLKELEEIINRAEGRKDRKILADSLSFIDLTSLNSKDTKSVIVSMTERVNRFRENFPLEPQVAAICVYPNFAKTVKETLTDKQVKIAVVAGVFPSSQSFPEIKRAECAMAVEAGADEVDIVLSLNHFLSGEYKEAAEEISLMKRAVGGAHLKVILESGVIEDPLLIYKASMLAMEAGADFIKTSTGKMEPAATPEAALVMCKAIRDFYNLTGVKVGFKPAGGVVTCNDAVKYYTIVETILGSEWLNSSLFRIGASRLANNLLSELKGETINYF